MDSSLDKQACRASKVMRWVPAILALALLIVTTSGFAVSSARLAATNTPGTIRLLPDLAEVDVGESVTVDVWLGDAGNYYGVDFRMSFDPTVVAVPAGRVTPLWDVFDSQNHFSLRNEANNAEGTVWYALTNINPAQPFTGTGRICSITFSGIERGNSVLDLYYAKGSTRTGETMWPTQVDGAILVGGPVQHKAYLPLVLVKAD